MDSTNHWSNPETGNIVSCVSLLVMLIGGVVSIGGFVMISSEFPNDNPLIIVGPVLVVCGALVTVIGALLCIFWVKPACCYRKRAEKQKDELFSTAVSSPSTEYVTTELGPPTPVTPSQAPPFSTIGGAYAPSTGASPPPSMSYAPVSELSTSSGYTGAVRPRDQKDSGDYTMPTYWK